MLSAMTFRTLERTVPALFIAAFVGLGLMPGAGCGGDELPEGQLCAAGEDIFCRCPGGDPGTKACTEAGDAFGECGPCTPRESTGPAGQGAGGFGLGGSVGGFGGSGPGAGGGMGTGALLEPCSDDSDCTSGMCEFNYCTKSCTAVSECPYPKSECAKLDALTICMPTCATAVDCVVYEAPPSQCGYTQAVDNWGVTTCANWEQAHALKPDGTDCLPFDHAACNLGYQQRQSVGTVQGICAFGCYVNADCPDGQACSSQGTLGNCQ
jgi:hypothetical protein